MTKEQITVTLDRDLVKAYLEIFIQNKIGVVASDALLERIKVANDCLLEQLFDKGENDYERSIK